MTATDEKLRAVALSAVMVFSVFAGGIAFGAGVAAAANTSGSVGLTLNAAGNQATVSVDDADLNTDSGSKQAHTVNIGSASEPVTGSTSSGSDTGDGSTQQFAVAAQGTVLDRNDDNVIDAADFDLTGASDESIVSTSVSSGQHYVTVGDSGGSTTDNEVETVSYTKLTIDGTGSDTADGGSTTITTTGQVGDTTGDGVVDGNDVTLMISASDETISSITLNADGTADVTISDAGGATTDSNPEQIRYVTAETVQLLETGADTGTFTGSISVDQTDSNGVLYAQDGDWIETVYWDDVDPSRKTATTTLSLSDTTSPSIANVALSESSGDMVISFDSDEQLGTSASDVAVSVSGPNGATYSFDRTDFSESGTGPYTYTLAVTQAYDDGDGTYGVSVDDAKDSAGNNGGNNGDGSDLTDSYSYSSGSDTTSPSISNVALSESSGNMVITFDSDEQLGTSASDVAVSVSGPNGATYGFDRSQFSESGSGPYRYTLSVTQAYDDGDGTYGVSVDDAKDPAGNNGGMNGDGSGLTDSYSYSSGSDTTSPSISNVVLSESSGNMIVSFDSDEQLGTSASDVAVSVSGPNGKSYSFDRSQFSESGSGPYTYTIAVSQAYDDGDGTYSMGVLDAKDSAGNNGGINGDGSGLTDSYSYSSGGGGGGNTYINGTVSDSNGPIKGVTVVAIPQSGSEIIATTDASGVYNLSVSAGTKYDLIADNDPEHKFEFKRGFTVSSGNTQVVDFTLTAYPDKGRINGTVLDSDGNPVSGVSVEARELGYRFGNSTTTDANGEFTMTVPESTYRMRASGTTDIPAQTNRSVSVTAGQTTDVTFRAPETGYITGTVTNESGAAQTGGVQIVADRGSQTFFGTVDNSGKYNISAPTGEYTVSVFARNGSGTSKDVTVTGGSSAVADFTLINTSVIDSSVEVTSGAGGVNTGDLGVRSMFQQGTLRVQVVNESSPNTPPSGAVGAPAELESAGVTSSTEFTIELTVTNFSANSLMWGINNSQWSTSTNTSVTNGTDITITGTPVNLQATFAAAVGGKDNAFGPVFTDSPQWATGRSDTADAGRNQTVYVGLLDLSNMPATVRTQLSGMSVTTNAQKFTVPKVENDTLEVWVGAPTSTVEGVDHTGFYQAEIPQAQLDAWGVDDPVSELNALYKGSQADFSVTDTASGARIRLDNIGYSAGYVEVESTADTTAPTADAGSDQSVDEDASLTLDGTASSDGETSISTYEWDVDGDGTYEKSGSTPSHTYGTPGTYTVTLRVTDGGGNTATDTVTVTAADVTAPTAAAGSDTTVDEGVSASFDASGSTDNVGIPSYEWDFDGDGTTDATGATPSHTFDTPGTYDVDLTATDGAGNIATDTVTVTVADATVPTASVGADTTVATDIAVDFDASASTDNVGIPSYEWDFDGDGTTDATGVSPTHTFSSAGTYDVTVTVTDAAGNAATATRTVTVEADSSESDSESDTRPVAVTFSGDRADVHVRVPSARMSIDVDQAGDSNVGVDATNVTFATDRTDPFTMNVSNHGVAPDSVPEPAATDVGRNVTGYLRIDHSTSEDELSDVRIRFSVSWDRLTDGVDAENVVLYRYHDGEWHALETALLGYTDAGAEFEARSAGLSVFAVGETKRAGLSVTSATLGSTTATAGDSVTVSAAVENSGTAAGTTAVTLSDGDRTLARQTVSVGAGETATVELTATVESAGEYALSVNGTDAGTLSVERAATPTPTPSPTATPTPSPTATATPDPTATPTPTPGDEGATATPTPADATASPATGSTDTAAPADAATATATPAADDGTDAEGSEGDTATPVETAAPDGTPTSSSGGSGFGALLALLALVGAALLARQRR